jgi:hypothetical protein
VDLEILEKNDTHSIRQYENCIKIDENLEKSIMNFFELDINDVKNPSNPEYSVIKILQKKDFEKDKEEDYKINESDICLRKNSYDIVDKGVEYEIISKNMTSNGNNFVNETETSRESK